MTKTFDVASCALVVSSSSTKSNISSEISSVSDWLVALTSGALTSAAKSTTGSATDGVAAVANVAASACSSNSSSKANDAISVASSLATATEVAASEGRLLDALVSDASKLKSASVVASLVGVTAGSAFKSKSKSNSSAILLSALGAAVGGVIIGSTAVAAFVDGLSGKLKSKSKSLSLIALLLLLTLLADVVVTGSSVTGATISVGDSKTGAATVSAVAGCLLGRSKSKSSKVNSFDCDCAAVVSVVGSVSGGTGVTGAILVSGTSSAKSKSNSLSALLLAPLARVAGCAASVTLGMATCEVLLMAGLSLSCLKPGKSKSSPSDSTASAVWVIAVLRAFILCSSSTSIFRLLAWVVRSASLSANTSE